MAEFRGGKEKPVRENEPIVFENKTDSSFDVSTGIVFHKSGIYEISILGNRTTVSRVTERKTEWIPYSERLPEEKMWTICQNNAGAMMIGEYDIEFGWIFPAYFNGIIAWMPLPEPYKEGDEHD